MLAQVQNTSTQGLGAWQGDSDLFLAWDTQEVLGELEPHTETASKYTPPPNAYTKFHYLPVV